MFASASDDWRVRMCVPLPNLSRPIGFANRFRWTPSPDYANPRHSRYNWYYGDAHHLGGFSLGEASDSRQRGGIGYPDDGDGSVHEGGSNEDDYVVGDGNGNDEGDGNGDDEGDGMGTSGLARLRPQLRLS